MRDVSDLTRADLLTLWRGLDLDKPLVVKSALMDQLPSLASEHFLRAATVSADWYDLMRSDLGVRGSFQALIPDPPTTQRSQVLARWGIGPLFSQTPAVDVALSKLVGGLTRLVLNGGRDTVVQSTNADPAHVGWARVGAGDCDFCQMLIDRGPVYGADSADFESHDHCHCSAVPSFD